MKNQAQQNSIETGLLDEPAMAGFAAVFAENLAPPLIVFLQGELGAGKTTFTRAVLRSLGYRGKVKSPTYGLLERYTFARIEIIHLDLYRIAQAGELEFLGLDDLHTAQAVFMIEWPDRGGSFLPSADLTIQFLHAGDERKLILTRHQSRAKYLFDKLHESLQ